MGNLSIVLSTYNEVENIKAAIDLSINHPVVKELIIIDDISTDGTIDILNIYKNRKINVIVRKI